MLMVTTTMTSMKLEFDLIVMETKKRAGDAR